MNKNLVTVIVPIHLVEPLALEKISLAQTLTVLADYPITFIAPTGLDVSWYEDFCADAGEIRFERFNWQGYEAYSVLMADAVFYKRFLKYEYVLICHLDAFVFTDELTEWCQSDYDFIGAVIYNTAHEVPNNLFRKLSGFTRPAYFANGGFGLKKVRTYYDMTSKHKKYIDLYHVVRKLRRLPFYDDLFFAQHHPYLCPGFKMAPLIDAQFFGAAYEKYDPDNLPFVNYYEEALPFGIHGWIQYNREYWLPCIRKFGYDV